MVTTFLGVGILSTERRLPMDRVYLLNPGQQLDVGDRLLSGLRPPLFDNPATVGVVDHKTGALFSSDCFGSPLPTSDAALAGDVHEVSPDDLRAGQLLWAGVDSPWVHNVDSAKFRASIDPIRTLDPSTIFSTHLPTARGLNQTLLEMSVRRGHRLVHAGHNLHLNTAGTGNGCPHRCQRATQFRRPGWRIVPPSLDVVEHSGAALTVFGWADGSRVSEGVDHS